MKKSLRIVIGIVLAITYAITSLGLTSIAVDSIKLSVSKITIQVGKTYTLKVSITPDNATNKKVTFSSENRKIAYIDKNGKIKGITEGKTTITVTSSSNRKKVAKCTVVVLREKMLLLRGYGERFDNVWFTYGGIAPSLLFKRLLVTDEKNRPVNNDLATTNTVSDNGLIYTFTIRNGVKWHDGVDFTAEDVVWSLHMALKSTQIHTVFSPLKSIVGTQDYIDGKEQSVKGIILNDNIITIRLIKPISTFLFAMSQFAPLPKHILKDEVPEKMHLAKFWQKPIGNGPYMLTQTVPGQYAIFERFAGYYGAKPKIEKIKITAGSIDTITLAQANEIDYTNTTSLAEVNQILKNSNFKAFGVDMLYLRWMLVNVLGYGGKGNSLIEDIKVRQAILYAIDRKSIADRLFPTQGSPLNTLVPTNLEEYNKEALTYDYNPSKAKNLLKEAKFDFSRTLRIAYYYTDQQTKDLMDAISFYLSEVGIKAESFLLQGDLVSAIYDKREYDLCYGGISAVNFEDVYNGLSSNNQVLTKLHSNEPNKFDPLLNQLIITSDITKRTDILRQLQAVEREYLWFLPLYSLKTYVLVNESRLKTAGKYGNEWTAYDRGLEKWELR